MSVVTRRGLVKFYLLTFHITIVLGFFLAFAGLEFTPRQWVGFLSGVSLTFCFNGLALWFIGREYRPIGTVLDQIARREKPTEFDLSRAMVQALNFPEKFFLFVALFHGLVTSVALLVVFLAGNSLFGTGYQFWQLLVFFGMVVVSAPALAMFQFFGFQRYMAPVLEQLSTIGDVLPDDRPRIRSIRLQNKLLFLVIFLTSVPLAVCMVSLLFKVRHLMQLSVSSTGDQVASIWMWAVGVVLVCGAGSLAMAVLVAREVSSSTAKLLGAMNEVERGSFDVNLPVTSTDEYADLFLGFNLMTEELRADSQTLKMSVALMGELQLDVLLQTIIEAATELLDAERGSLFIYDPKSDELWSRVASGLSTDGSPGLASHSGGGSGMHEIRFPASVGIAGAVFTSGKFENLSDPYADPRFNPEFDRRTGFRTRSILTMPISAKNGTRIGVTQVLNKRGGQFTAKDAARLRAFTNQIAIALENARLFDDVLRMKNFNDSILRSTSNGMITINDHGHVTSANDAALSILQMTRENLVGPTATELFGNGNDWLLTSLAKVSSTGTSDVTVDTELQLANGKVASANLTVAPLIDPGNKSIGTMLILDDITREKRIKTTMSRYMSKEVADQVLEAGETLLGGRDQKVSVLFADIRNFTHMSEAIGPRETVTMLNEYFEEMVDVVFRHRGILDKYIGDAIMALFGSPLARPDDADQAVAVANEMIVTLRALNQRRTATGRAPIDIGIGISTGQVIAGSIGSPKRMEYTAIGDNVNLASRLEEATKVYGAKSWWASRRFATYRERHGCARSILSA